MKTPVLRPKRNIRDLDGSRVVSKERFDTLGTHSNISVHRFGGNLFG